MVVHFDLVPGTNATEKYHAAMVSSKFQAVSGNDTAGPAIASSWRVAGSSLGQGSTLGDGIELNHGYKEEALTASDYSGRERMA